MGCAIFVAAVTALALVGAAGPAGASDGAASPAAAIGALAWSSCDEGVAQDPPAPAAADTMAPTLECASLPVPLDYGSPAAGTVTLALYRLRTANTFGRLGDLVMNPGGPGAETRGFLMAIAGAVPEEVAQRYDLVAFDPRGVGGSQGLTCGTGDDLTAGLDDPVGEQLAYAQRLAAQCLAEGGPLVATMTAVNAARDLESVRQALGDPLLHYLGYSYGTAIGSVYAELFPKRVGRMVLDGPVNPDKRYRAWVADQVEAFDAALVRFSTWCDAQPSCQFPGVSALEVWRYLDWRAGTDGLPAARGPRVSRAVFESATIFFTYAGDEVFPLVGAALHAAYNGDAGRFASLVATNLEGLPSGAYFAGVCGDDPSRPPSSEDLHAIAERIEGAPHLYWAMREVLTCAFFPVSGTPLPKVSLARGETAPVLVVGNQLDPATPYSGAVAMAAALGGSRLLTYEGSGHTIVFSGVACIDAAATAYLVDGTLPAAATSCPVPA